jgi:hypothetical protein
VPCPRCRCAPCAIPRGRHQRAHPLDRCIVGDAVDAAGIALPPNDQYGENRGERLGDDREIDAADSSLEHCNAEDKGEHYRDDDYRDEGER